MGRNPEFQAILPLRGNSINVEKTRLDKMLANNEIRSMITAFGTGIDTEFHESKLRYHKIVCMTDADVDGAHMTHTAFDLLLQAHAASDRARPHLRRPKPPAL